MSTVPANASDVESVIERRLATLFSSNEARQTATIEWRGHQKFVPVIDMPIKLLYYNPETHRIRAQRAIDPERERALENDPYGAIAQDYLDHLLKGSPQDPGQEDPTFAELRESLRQHGQEEPGVITRAGVLVNGNTRCAALRELHKEHIRVGVLDADAGADDVRAIELSLQLRKEYKRDYSFVNFLLAVQERSDAGLSDAEIMTEFRIREATLKRSRWILNLIENAISRSRSVNPDGSVSQLRLIDFESHQGKLEELYRAYTTRKQGNPEAAEALLEQRLVALILDKSKTDLRLIDAEFMSTYLPTKLPDASDAIPAVKTIPGLTIPAQRPSKSLLSLTALTNQVLQAKAVVVDGADGHADTVAASKRIQQMTVDINDALLKAGKSAVIRQRQIEPSERIADAVEDLGLAAGAIAAARAGTRFRTEDVDDALTSLRDAVVKLAKQVAIGANDSVGDGVTWLLRASTILGE
jgi:hypothetical protein